MREISIKQHLNDITSKQVLEIGTGFGSFTAILAERFDAITSVDLEQSEEMQTKLMDRFGPKIKFIKSMAENYNDEMSYDLVAMAWTIHHLTNVRNVFHKAFEKLSPRGKIFIAEESPLTSSVHDSIHKEWHAICQEIDGHLEIPHYKEPLSQAVVDMLCEVGFINIKTKEYYDGTKRNYEQQERLYRRLYTKVGKIKENELRENLYTKVSKLETLCKEHSECYGNYYIIIGERP